MSAHTQYLRSSWPDSGDAMGDLQGVLALGVVRIAVTGLDADTYQRMHAHFGSAWVATGGVIDGEVQLRNASPAAFHSAAQGTWEYALSFDQDLGTFAGLGFCASSEGAVTKVLWGEDRDLVVQALANAARVTAAACLPKKNRLLIHSGAVVGSDGRVWLCPGRSGTGKTTFCRMALAAGRSIVGDELHVIQSDGTVWGTPFAGELPPALDCGAKRLGAIIRLHQAARTRVEMASRGAGAAALLTAAPVANHTYSVGEIAMDVASSVASSVPVIDAYVRKDDLTIFEQVDRALGGGE